MRRFTLPALALAIGLGIGVATAAGAPEEPRPEDVSRWCSVEQQGAHALAEDLRGRGRELDAREASLRARAQQMSAAEARLDERLSQLEAARSAIEAQLAEGDAAREERVAALVKMVEAGRAAQVAAMFGALDDALAVDVLERMNRAKAGKLLAALPPQKAAALAAKLTSPIAVALP
jgi:flagellar motility protein MotE (MotC chaperone)